MEGCKNMNIKYEFVLLQLFYIRIKRFSLFTSEIRFVVKYVVPTQICLLSQVFIGNHYNITDVS